MSDTVTIQRNGQAISISPFVDELRCFWTPRNEAIPDSAYGIRLTTQSEPLWWRSRKGVTLMPAGLEPLVAEFLEQAGFQVARDQKTVRTLPKPNPAVFADECCWDPEFLNFVSANERGVIRYFPASESSPGVNPYVLIRQAILAWPDQRILILCTREQEVRQVANRLSRAVPIYSGDGSKPAAQVVVTTYDQTHKTTVDLRSIDLCFILNPTECFSLRPTFSKHPLFEGRPESPARNDWFWQLPATARLFGLLSAGKPLTIQQRDLLLMLFGHRALTIPEHGKLHRSVVVAYARYYHRSSTSNESILPTKRRLIWNNSIRNRRIAQLAKELKAGNTNSLESHCFDLVFDETIILLWTRVVIVVDSLDHAYQLSKHLPQVPVVFAESPNFAGWRPQQIDWLQASQQLPPAVHRLLIATRTGLPLADPHDVIIDATASAAPLSLPTELLLTDVPRPSLLLIDVLDEGNPLLDRLRLRRQAAHHAKQFDHNNVTNALAQFLQVGAIQ